VKAGPGIREQRSRLRLTGRAALLLGAISMACADPPAAEWMKVDVTEPTLFAPGVVSTNMREYGITFTPDGREAYFTRRERRGPSQIHVTRFVEGSWSEPVPAPFADPRDEAPFITADGSRMLFASSRPLPTQWDESRNLWTMSRGPDGWLEPTPLGPEVNRPRTEVDEYTLGLESGPHLMANGSLLFWGRSDPDWGSDLFVSEADSEGGFGTPRPLTLNSYGDESNPAMSPDGRYLVFQAYRASDGPGEEDLFVSERSDHGWSAPRPFPEPINSSGNDGFPSFTADGRFFFFASDRDARSGFYDIYCVSVDALRLSPAESR